MSTPIPENVHIGTRIQVGKDRATVKFIGKVGDAQGAWLGIEWDDPARGKHDGTHQGTSYFTCR
jgi:dynactin complex subunit